MPHQQIWRQTKASRRIQQAFRCLPGALQGYLDHNGYVSGSRIITKLRKQRDLSKDNPVRMAVPFHKFLTTFAGRRSKTEILYFYPNIDFL